MKNIIKQLRKESGLRQEELAQAVHVTRQTIIAVENNKYNPTLELAVRLSLYLGVSVNELFILEE